MLVADRLRRFPVVARMGVVAAALGLFVLGTLQCRVSRTATPIAFWFEDGALTLPSGVIGVLGGAITSAEADAVMSIARAEVQKAFAGLRLRIVDGREGFWRVAVVATFPVEGPLPVAGNALPLGPLGGMAWVGADEVSLNVVHYAPPRASRSEMIEAIGRGIGRVAVHEVAHQIIGVAGSHNDDDEYSYEYPSPARAAQYYSELHWTTWWPELQRRVGQ